MEKQQLTASETEATATALVKQAAPESLLVPWQDGEPFKLSKKYLLQLYKKRNNLSDSPFRGEFNDFYSFEEFSISIKEKGNEKFTVYFSVTKAHFAVRCSCGKAVQSLCEHAAAVFHRKLPDHYAYYFKQLYNETLLALPKKFRSMVQVSLKEEWNKLTLKLENSPAFGHIYDLNITDKYDWTAWHYSPTPHRGVGSRHETVTSVEFIVIVDHLFCGLPYFLPYVAEGKSGRKLSKSYFFHQDEGPDLLAPKDVFKEQISRRIVGIARDGDYRHPEAVVVDENSKNNNRSKVLGILAEWRKLIGNLGNEEKLCFAQIYGYREAPGQAKLKDAYHKINLGISLSDGAVRLVINIEDNPSYMRLTFNVYYQDVRLETPRFIGNAHCFFLHVSEDQVVFIDDLDLENVLRHARQCDYILTVLDGDRTAFLKNSLRFLTQRYETHVIINGKQGNTMPQIKKPKRIVYIQKLDEHLVVKAYMDYEHYGQQPLAPHANLLVRNEEESKRYRYAYRHIDTERAFYDYLQRQHPSWSDQRHESLFTLPLQRIDHSQWLTNFTQHCKAEGIEVQLEGIDRGSSYYPHLLRWEVRQVKLENNTCEILLAPKFRDKVIPLMEFEDMVTNTAKVYPLGRNQYGVIRSSDIALFKPIFLSAEIDGDILKLNTLQMISLQNNLEKIDPKIIDDSIRERRERLAKLDEIPQLEVPATIQAKLRPYQQAGFSWMAFLNEFQWGGLLADDMGLGKTLQVITLLEHFYTQHPQEIASLIVLPNSLLFNWQSEYEKFAPSRQVVVYHGTDRRQITDFEAGSIVLTTYGMVMSSIDFFATKSFAYLIMDESQNAKNRNSKRFESLVQIHALYRIAMTGTPIENGIQDIYAQMTLVNPGFFGNYRAFNKMYKGVLDLETAEATLASLQKMIQPFILRRTKKQVALDLPDKTETILRVDMAPAQRKIYDKYRKLYREEVQDSFNSEDPSKSKFVALEALIKLRQLCNSPHLLKGETFAKDSIKLDYIDEILDDVVAGHKVLLFSSFTGMLQLVAERIQQRDIQYAYLDGKLSQKQRQTAVEKFQNEEACRLFLISLKAGGTGLNLTAADYVYILDPWWNPAAEAQAIDRCYRIGQEKHVNAYKLVCRDSVEEKILALQEHKKKLADGLILDETNIMKSMSKEELLKLFE